MIISSTFQLLAFPAPDFIWVSDRDACDPPCSPRAPRLTSLCHQLIKLTLGNAEVACHVLAPWPREGVLEAKRVGPVKSGFACGGRRGASTSGDGAFC